MDVRELLAGHHANVFAFLYRMTGDAHLAEDLMQETFVRALRAAERYEPRGKVSTWLFSIAANAARDHWRRQQRRPEVTCVELAYGSQAVDGAPEDEMDIRAALLNLPLEQRSVLILRYYHDLSYAEIAETLVIPLGTVRSRIHKGLERLKASLAEEVGAP
ncbi:MAG TPA: RNA polymerase sigma factor [Symbiobacteriaceae bacterium]|nr:RNA polymerase sigma factor [Symbiobacteriaceae bacterium]